jgi:hypothetical protein
MIRRTFSQDNPRREVVTCLKTTPPSPRRPAYYGRGFGSTNTHRHHEGDGGWSSSPLLAKFRNRAARAGQDASSRGSRLSLTARFIVDSSWHRMCHCHSMASNAVGSHPTPQMRATVRRMHRDPPWESATRSDQKLRRPDGPEKRQLRLNEVAVVVCLLALIGVSILGGALMLLSWMTATTPVSSRKSCPEIQGCAETASYESDAVLVDDDWIYGPKLTR